MQEIPRCAETRMRSPLVLTMVILTVASLTELLIMLVLPTLHGLSPLGHAAVDVTVLAALLSALLWYLALRPMYRYIRAKEIAEEALQDAYRQLESLLGQGAGGGGDCPLRDGVKPGDEAETTRARLQHLMNATPAVIYAFRPYGDFGVTFVSENARRIMGYAPDQFTGDCAFWATHVHPEDLPGVQDDLPRLLEEGLGVCKYRFLHGDGSYHWVRDEKAVVRDAGGSAVEIVGACTDITARRDEEAVRGRMVAIINAMPDLVATADAGGHLLTLNDTGRQMLGLGQGEDIAALCLADIIAPGAREVLVGEAIPTATLEGAWTGETMLLDTDGKETVALQTLLAHRDAAGRVDFLSTIMHDVSHSRQLEEELRQAQKMQAVGQLAGGVAHDFNNMLMPILTYAGFLVEKLEPLDHRRRYAEEIMRTAERAASLPRQLLAFSRKQVMRPVALDLGRVVADMHKMLQRLIGEDIELATVSDPSLGVVMADPGQMEQVLMNLAVNARDAMPDGGKLTIETHGTTLGEEHVRSRPDLRRGPYVMLAVSDTGVGIDKEVQSRIFEPFFTTKEVGKGTGLGLSTVYGIVKQSGGDIRVYSEPGHGTTFRIYLARVDVPVADPRSRGETGGLQAGSETLLLVEDDDAVREAVLTTVESAGYRVLDAAGGTEALKLSAEHSGPIHLMITDVVMPGLNGPRLAEQMTMLRPELKVLYMSGYTADAILRHGVLDPGVELIQKPFTPGALTRKLRQMLDGPQTASAT